ncbi:caspase family protein [Thermodesulfobacteriota bacterium]
MEINRINILLISLFMFILCSLFSPLSIQASSRGITVINDLSHQSGKLGAYRALIIGINDYKDPKIPDLETAVNDAKAIAELLGKRYGFQVELILNQEATKKAMYRALRDLASSTKPDDSVLIYYAGHGDLDRTYDDGWWIPSDAIGGDSLTYLDNVQVQKSMRSMKARHVLLISDSCYSGTLFGQGRAMPKVIDDKYYLNLYNEKSRWGMTSGNKTPVSDTGTGGHSVFAYQLIKTLRKNEKHFISTQEIYTQIAPIVSNNSEQTPLYRPIRNTGDQGGEFVFVTSSGSKADVDMDTDKIDAELATERNRLKQERMELERLKIEIEKEKLEAERKKYKQKTTERALLAKQENWQFVRGNWRMVGESLIQINTNSRPSLIIAKSINRSKYTLEFKAMKIEGREAFLVVFHYQRLDRWLMWNLGGWGNTKSAIEHDNWGRGKIIRSTVTKNTFIKNRWYDIKIDVNGYSFRGYIDGVLILDVILPNWASSSGSIGFATWNTSAEIKNIKIQYSNNP